MKQLLEQRLKTLKDEFASGQKVMAELEQKQTDLQHTMLRIGGAIQVLEELLQEKTAKQGGAQLDVDDAEKKPVAAVKAVTTTA